jgi:histone deacetylase 11
MKKSLISLLIMSLAVSCYSSSKTEPDKQPGKPLGNRVAIVYSSNYLISLLGLEKLHPFDIKKYAKIQSALIKDKLLKAEDFYSPEYISDKDILRVHTSSFLKSLKSSKTVARYTEAPAMAYIPNSILTNGVIMPFRYATGGTLLASRLALRYGIAINIGGGYHHAKPSKGEGFCIFADMPIAIRVLQSEDKIKRALVIDLDVHQGNGTAVCLADDNTTFTFSMHQGNIYPIPKEQSDLDIELDSGTDDKTFLATLAKHLDKIIEKSKPDIVFLQAGCDTLDGDPLASLKMTAKGIAKRDMMVIDACAKHKIPVVMTLGGGYSSTAWQVQFNSIRDIINKYGGK